MDVTITKPPDIRYQANFKDTFLGTFNTEVEAKAAKEGAEAYGYIVRREISKQIGELSREVDPD